MSYIENDAPCSRCGAQPDHYVCERCGAEAMLVNCGHYPQPRPIASDGTDCLCESCWGAREERGGHYRYVPEWGPDWTEEQEDELAEAAEEVLAEAGWSVVVAARPTPGEARGLYVLYLGAWGAHDPSDELRAALDAAWEEAQDAVNWGG